MKDGSLWLNLILLQRPSTVRQNTVNPVSSYSRGGVVLPLTRTNAFSTLPVSIGTSAGLCAGPVQGLIPLENVSKRVRAQGPSLRGIFFPKACTPVRLENMCPWLDLYPNGEKADLLIEGFSVGFPLPSFLSKGCTIVDNLKSINHFPQVVREKVFKEIAESRMAGPFQSPPFEDFHISPLGWFPIGNRIPLV